ncbi:MAG: cyclase family protein, partial [Aldersonia sp.]|nr:cyclase family protein [Aldersonia sp.]
MSTLADLVTRIGSGAVEVLDLTAPLSSETPILHLPEPFANTIPASLEPVSAFDDAGPMWSWNNLHTGEHTGTHLDAPTHWITGRDGTSVADIPPTRLIGPAAVVDVSAEAQRDPDFLLEPEDLEAWQREHGTI